MISKFWLHLVLVTLILAVLVVSVFAGTPYVNRIKKDEYPKESLIFMQWNIANLGKSKMEKHPEAFKIIAAVMREADLVAIQEVSSSDAGAFAVAKLVDELNRTGSKWDYVISDPTPGTETERFAFLWKASKFWVNRNDNKLTTSFRGMISRGPAMMTFHTGNKKFTVASFHLQPDNKRNGKNPRKEVAGIGANPTELATGPMIFAGDFNLAYVELDSVFEGVLKAKHNIEGKTSLKAKLGKKGEYLEKEYDNIYTRGVIVHKAAIYDFVQFAGGLQKARKVSDHLPVFIVFSP